MDSPLNSGIVTSFKFPNDSAINKMLNQAHLNNKQYNKSRDDPTNNNNSSS